MDAVDPFADHGEGHENHERYLITYADMITLLMALFIILFAIGQVDAEKFREFQEGLQEDFGAPLVLEGGGGLLPEPVTNSSESPGAGPHSGGREETTVASLQDALRPLSDTGVEVTVRPDPRGVLVSLVADEVVFASGSAALEPRGRAVVDRLAEELRDVPNDIVVEGHTDSQPVAPPGSNWQLSSDRATAIVERLITDGVTPTRLSAVGLADTVPVGSNDTDIGRAHNRRIDILVVVPGAADGAGRAPLDAPVGVDLRSEAFGPG